MLVQLRPLAVVIAASICLAGCDRLGVLPARNDNGRYQLMKDVRGQTLRLDTVTGQIVVVDSSTIPAEGSSERRAQSAQATSAGATPLPAQAEPQVPQTPDEPADQSPAPAVTTRATQAPPAAANACERIGDPDREFVVSTPADAFVEPNRPGVPVASLASGTLVQGINVEGNWLLVRFHDQVWGDRTAYIACSRVLANEDGGSGQGRPTN